MPVLNDSSQIDEINNFDFETVASALHSDQ